MSFSLAIDYDTVSRKSRMIAGVKVTLTELFRQAGKEYTACFLRIANNRQTQAARSTTYVLCEGFVNSSQCFGFSKHCRERKVWITPAGWKVATIACLLVFTAETKILDEKMQYRFGLVRSKDAGDSKLGEWHVNVQAAFAYMDRHLTDDTKATLANRSKELILAVHTTRVQNMLWAKWEALKLNMSEADRIVSRGYEDNPQLDGYAPHLHPQVSVTEEEEDEGECSSSQDYLANPHGVLSPQVITSVLREVEGNDVSSKLVTDILLLLEAGLGVRADYLFSFLQMVEDCASRVWESNKSKAFEPTKTLEECWACELQADQNTLEFRAALFVFGRMAISNARAQRFTNTQAFCRSLTGISKVKDCKARFDQLYPR